MQNLEVHSKATNFNREKKTYFDFLKPFNFALTEAHKSFSNVA
jgi:hypothetical protein